MKQRGQQGYVLFTVIVMLVVVAVGTLLISYDSSLKASMPAGEAESARADYVAEAAMQHALWQSANNACMGDVTIPTTALGQDSYEATVTGAAAGTFHTLTADQDAWIRSDDATRNNGTTVSNHVKFQFGNIEQILTRFDLSSLPADAQINSATAWFYIRTLKPHPDGPITIHEVTSDWAETSVTWESFDGNYKQASVAMIPAQDKGDVWVSINLTGLVQAWVNGQPNYGVLFNSIAEGVHPEYMAREDGSNPPRLEVVVGSGQASPVTIQATGTLDNGVTRTLSRPIHPAYQPPGTVTLQLGTDPGADAMLDDFYPRNYGGGDFVQVNENTGNWVQRPVFRFDLGRVPAHSSVLSAQLELRLRSIKTPGTATIHRVARSWIEGTKDGTGTADGATWATYDGSNNWTTAGGDFNAAPVAETAINGGETWVTWEIGPLVEQWLAGEPNNGLLIKGDAALREAEFYTQEEVDATLRPKLTITYACECGNPCMGPQGSGRIALIGDDNSPDPDDQLKIQVIESWGYEVDFYEDQDSDTINWSNYDLVYVSETVISGDVSANLTDLSIGVVNEEPKLYDDLQLAGGDTEHVGSTINIVDSSHFITSIFPPGPLSIYTGGMEILTANAPLAGGLQTLGEFGGAASLTALDKGAQTTTGTAAGRRVTLPLGQHFAAGFDWTNLGHNGHLLVQRAIAWGMNADVGAGTSGKLLFVVTDAASPMPDEVERQTLVESWGYVVTRISDEDSQANFDAAASVNDLAYISGDALYNNVGVKLADATIGVAFESYQLHNEFGMSPGSIALANLQSITITDNAHYITSPFSGSVNVVSANTQLSSVSSYAPETQLGLLASIPGYDGALATFNTGDLDHWGATVAGRRVKLPWGSTDWGFDFNSLSADGQNILKRSLEWIAGAEINTTYAVLMVVADPSSLNQPAADRKTLMESWGYTVTLIDSDDTSANFIAAIDVADVVYIGSGTSPTDVLTKVVTNIAIGVVNEPISGAEILGFASSWTVASVDQLAIVDSSHSITQGLANPVTVFTTSKTTTTLSGTFSPDLQNLAEAGAAPAIAVLETGARQHDVGTTPGRRAQLPFSSAEGSDLTADGQLIVQRAIEWAVGADAGSGEPKKVLFVVGNDTGLTSEETAHKTLIESWGYTVELIDDDASQAEFDTAVANNDVAYATNDITASRLSTKLVDATIGVVYSEDNLSDEFGLSSSIDWESGSVVEINDNTHYITSPFSTGVLTIFSGSESLAYLTGTLSPDLGQLASSSSGYGVVTLEAGAATYGFGNGITAGRRVQLPWGGSPSLDPSDLNADGRTILQRAIEWGAGSGGPLTVMFVVGDQDNLNTWEIFTKALVESWGYTVAPISSTLPQSELEIAASNADVVFVQTANLLATKLRDVTTGLVNASVSVADDFGFSSSGDLLFSLDQITVTDTSHYITSGYSAGPLTVFTELQAMDVTGGALASGLQGLADVVDSGSDPVGLGVIETGGGLDGGGTAPARRVQLPFGLGSKEFLNVDGLTLLRRAVEWAAGADGTPDDGGGGGGGGGGGSCVADDFESGDYSGNTGTLNWASDWTEFGDDGRASAGDERVQSEGGDQSVRVRDNDNGGEGIEREADLSSFSSGTLQLEYRRHNLDNANDYVAVEISANGGGAWTELDRFPGAGSDSEYQLESYDISAHLSSNTRIRFITAPNMGNTDAVYFDNIEICD